MGEAEARIGCSGSMPFEHPVAAATGADADADADDGKMPPPPRRVPSRSFSVVSQAALDDLDVCEITLREYQRAIDEISKSFSDGSLDMAALQAAKSELAQLNGHLEKLQMQKIDSVVTA